MPRKLVILGEAQIGHAGVPASFFVDCSLFSFMASQSMWMRLWIRCLHLQVHVHPDDGADTHTHLDLHRI